MIDLVILSLLGCVNINNVATHIHVQVEGLSIPNATGVTPYFGGTDSCVREMHTHFDKYLHLESSKKDTIFTLRPFLKFLYKDNWGDTIPVQISNVTINGQPADIDTPLKNLDKIVVNK